MKKNLLLFTLFFLYSFASNAQDIWPLTANLNPTNTSGISGATAFTATTLGLNSISYTNSVFTCSPTSTSGTWNADSAANLTGVFTRYIEFKISPSPNDLNISQVSYNLSNSSATGTALKMNLYYYISSSGPPASLSNMTAVSPSSLGVVATNPVVNLAYPSSIVVPTGNTIYFRLFPVSSSAVTNRYLYLSNFQVNGSCIPPNTVSAASSSPTVCINTPLTNITHTTSSATGIGTATGLPTDVTASWSNNTITISGTPSTSGTYNYSIPLTGGYGNVNATGTIIVNNNNSANVNIAASTSTICLGGTAIFTATPTNGGTSPSYQWKVNGVNSGTNSATFSTNTIANNDVVNVVLTSNATPCLIGSPATSNSITMTVNATSNGGTASSNQTICSGDTPSAISLVGKVGNVIKWQSATNSGFTSGVIDIANTTTTLTLGSLISTTYYRAVVQSGICSSANSNVITITVNQPPVVGTASAVATTICSGNSTTINFTSSAGSIQWQSSNTFNGSYSNVTGTTNSFSTGTITATTYYKAVITSGACIVTTNKVTVTVNSPSVAGTASNATICSGTDTTLTLTGYTGSQFYWQSSSASTGPYTQIPGATSATLPTGSLTSTTYFQAVVRSIGCLPAISIPIIVTVNNSPSVFISGPTTSICKNSIIPLTVSGTGTSFTWSSNLPNSLFTDASATIAYDYITSPNTTTIYVKPSATAIILATATSGITGCASTSITLNVLPGTLKTYTNAWTPSAPTSNDPIEINGNYSGGSLQGCNCLITGGTVSFNSGETLSLVNELTISGGTLTFEDSSSLVQTNDVINSGSINFKRTTQPINRYDYNYWSSPVSAQTLFGLSPDTLYDKYFYYDAANTDYWANSSSNAIMNPGQGYIIRGPQTFDTDTRQSYTGIFTGIPNNGTITTPIVSGRYNLIGNPYPSALDANLFLSNTLNDAVVEGTIYLWTHNTPVTNFAYNPSDYAVYNLTGATGTAALTGATVLHNWNIPNGNIASGEAFFIKGIGSGNATFNNTMRVAGNNNQFFKNSAVSATENSQEKNRIWLGVTNDQGAYKETLIGYVSGASIGLDRGYDGELLSQTPACIYSLSEEKELSIQGRPLPFQDSDKIPIGFHAETNGNFTISLVDYDGLFANQDIFLEDKFLNIIQNIKTSNYNFISNSGTFNNRFILRYTNSSINSFTTPFSEDSVVVFKNDKNLQINTSNTIIKSVAIFDIRGRELFNQLEINSSQFEVTNFNSSQQVVLVKITSVEGRIVTKKIIF